MGDAHDLFPEMSGAFVMRSRLTLSALALTLAIGACNQDVPTSPAEGTTPQAQFQNNSRQTGLVNVSTGDVALLNNVNLAVAANVIANVCNVTIPVAVLATQVVAGAGDTFCSGTANPITITQSTPGSNAAPAGGNNSRQAGLVNVSLGDVNILNDVNAAIAANVLVNACNVTVPIAVLAVQGVFQGTPAGCTTTAGPISITQ
jgi:hypothetical protein